MEDSAFQTCRLHVGRFVDLHPTRRRPRRSEAEPVTITATAMLLPAFELRSLRNWAHEVFREGLLFDHNAQAAQRRKQWCDALLASVAVLPNLGAATLALGLQTGISKIGGPFPYCGLTWPGYAHEHRPRQVGLRCPFLHCKMKPPRAVHV